MSSRQKPRTRAEAKNAVAGRSGPKRWSWPKRIIVTLAALFALGVAGLAIAYAVIQPPTPNDYAVAQTSIVYFSDGKTEMARISDVNRESVPLSQIPKSTQQAMIAAEDREFYTNSGISPSGIARAVWAAATGGERQGGSTITQQYVKNYFLTQDQTISRKAKEILIAMKIDGQQSKDEILANYLNTIYYGRNASGIKTAALAYFKKDVTKLTVAESAVLASVIRAPSLYDPRLGKEQQANLTSRWNYVLDGMVTMGYLSPEARAKTVFPTIQPWTGRTNAGPNGYIVQIVKDELEQTYNLTPAAVDRGGFKVVTTIDKAKQDAAVKAVKDQMPSSAPELRVGLASIKPGDGAVQAMYGGADYAKVQFNAATNARLQAGSTFKIFTLIAGLRAGEFSTGSTFSGASPQYFKEFEAPGDADAFSRRGGVRNAGNAGYGTISVKRATASSVNTVYAQLNILATPQKTMEAAKDAGVRTPLLANYGNVLGTDDVTVIDMANAYATIAAEGNRATPYFVSSIKSADGNFDVKATPKVTRVFDAALTSDVIDCMEAVVQGGTGHAAQAIGRPAAGKTGTTTGNKAAWFDGFVPQLATAVGVYRPGPNNENLEMTDIGGVGSISGGGLPTSVWTDYMTAAVQGLPVVEFPTPAHINKNVKPPEPTFQPPTSTSTPTPPPSPSITPTPSSSSTPTTPPTTAPPTTAPPTTAPPTSPPPTSAPPPTP